MLPIGQLALYFAFGIALILGILPLLGVRYKNTRMMYTARPLAVWLFVLVLISFIMLGYAFWVNDFSYDYVLNHSNTKLPWFYKLTAIWGGHEGSMLLWVLTLTTWMLLVTFFTRRMPIELSATTLAILGWIGAGFIAFLIFTSDPFTRNFGMSLFDGRDLNPLLQDFGLVIHPPLLYFGYVGYAVPYAFVCALLMTGHVDRISIRWIRPWSLAAWSFLTLGMTIGSWWAYYELGWGGWWFWDPVENASLIPWILGTALLHSLAMTEKRQAFTLWTVIMAITTFSLSVLGTFLVRSGVLTSVHSFASDPSRGLFILLLLAIVALFGLVLLLLRSGKIRQESHYGLVSKESAILANNILLAIACFVVLLGTLYPLIIDILDKGKISVGEGYFNQYTVPIAIILMGLLGFAPLLRFREDSFYRISKQLAVMGIAAIVLGVGLSLFYAYRMDIWSDMSNPSLADKLTFWIGKDYLVTIGLIFAFWIVGGIIAEISMHRKKGQNFIQAVMGQSLSRWGMNLGHLGFVIVVVGISVSTHYSIERDVLIKVGETVSIRQYDFTLEKLERADGSNYMATRGTFNVKQNGKELKQMYPEKRFFTVSGSPMSEVALRASLIDDLYIALAEERSKDSWAVRLYVKPFVRWIWLGGIIISIAAFFSIFDRRYRITFKQREVA